jgi:hypothetical protein
MNRCFATVVPVLIAACAGGLLPLVTMKPAIGAPGPTPQSVLVINSAAQPVPTAPQGTTTVQGSVSASSPVPRHSSPSIQGWRRTDARS